jgi:hypothetical protein
MFGLIMGGLLFTAVFSYIMFIFNLATTHFQTFVLLDSGVVLSVPMVVACCVRRAVAMIRPQILGMMQIGSRGRMKGA